MDRVLVRYGEIGTKSRAVRGRMLTRLRNRVAERLDHEGLEATVRSTPGRIVVETDTPKEAAAAVAELPGVVSTSPAVRTEPGIGAIERATDRFEVGATFGVRANNAGDHGFSSHDVSVEVGARVEGRTGASVDLDDPETWVEVDVREDDAYVFTERIDGPGGFPVGTQEPVAALVSGGIDSPVAAYEAMTRGSDVVPVYAYNRPIAAGDHVARFEAALAKLARVHPAKGWYYHLVDMEEANDALFEVGAGRMLLHRAVMFRVAERIVEDEGLSAIVTGESVGQKSSQTVANLAVTTAAVRTPVLRPLLTRTKGDIVERARRIGTFEEATVNSACRSLAPDGPATRMDRARFDELAAEVDLDGLVEAAWEATERVELRI